MNEIIQLPKLAAFLRSEMKAGRYPENVSVDDGEYHLCRSCLRAGYGVDSWLLVSPQNWATLGGKLITSKCKACRSEVAARKFGFVPDGIAA